MSIKVSNVTKEYGNQLAVNNLSFSVKKGEIVGFLGPNGAGKSSLLKMLTGYIDATEGELFVCDELVSTQTKITNANVGYLPEHNPMYKEMYVREYLSFIASVHKIANVEVANVIAKTGLEQEANKYAKLLGYNYQSSQWYEKSYQILNKDYEPRVLSSEIKDKKSGVIEKFKRLF